MAGALADAELVPERQDLHLQREPGTEEALDERRKGAQNGRQCRAPDIGVLVRVAVEGLEVELEAGPGIAGRLGIGQVA
jgi:hypothetical protein